MISPGGSGALAEERRALMRVWNRAQSDWSDVHVTQFDAAVVLPLERVLRELEILLETTGQQVEAALSRL